MSGIYNFSMEKIIEQIHNPEKSQRQKKKLYVSGNSGKQKATNEPRVIYTVEPDPKQWQKNCRLSGDKPAMGSLRFDPC